MGRSLPTIRPALLTSPEPIAPSERIDGIDILRGLALFGVLTINVVFEFRVSIFAQFLPPARTDSAIDRALNSFLAAAVELKALALFSFLFGVGLAIQFDRLAGNPRRFVLLLRRLIVLLAIIALIAWLLRRSFIRVYSKAQIALQETLNQVPPVKPMPVAVTLPSLLRAANLEKVEITSASPAAGKLIHDLQLRTQTGASIVGIERNGQNIINPGPDEELQSDDQILLLGSRDQLDAAIAALK